ncbi:DUF512 domain-containing protein [Halarsenatibacter silvermanii]|uniref:Radical SAM superfamily enzyme, MoaA/NifB/PqqE/SkfB family n=1 Tax=Halarsenatibacter silvermanii TaxID=321763 RepID=A0A1G9NET9_9FIRM|nr:DUF512 domain-containing protein [Halarsenatibacter silvermanii]SDL85012.1 Protein of unknown function [Halarsenatibacter silvermanii]
MKQGLYLEFLYRSVQEQNILPLTSNCPLDCYFCSHKFQPSEVKTLSPGHIDRDRILDLSEFLDGSHRIIIGESASRIEEGEPFCHPGWREVIAHLRSKFPKTPINITTSGVLLKREDIEYLARMRPLKLCISLNFISSDLRADYLRDGGFRSIEAVLHDLNQINLPCTGSLVALPKLAGWKELKRSLEIMDRTSCIQHVRIFRPGYTSRIKSDKAEKLDFKPESFMKKLESWRGEFTTPIIFEPRPVYDLQARIVGVKFDSPAATIGLKRGDIIESVAENQPFSRVEAFSLLKNHLRRQETFELEIKRNVHGENEILQKKVKPGEVNPDSFQYEEVGPGVIMARDISPAYFCEIKRYSRENSLHLLITAPAAKTRIRLLKNKLNEETGESTDYKMMTVRPQFFGGNIEAAGLLVISDVLKNKEKICRFSPDSIFLSDSMFDHRGEDLLGEHRGELERRLPAPVYFI